MNTLVCMQDLVEAQAGDSPNAVALVCDDQRLTYRDLDERANRLARHLRRLGVAGDTLVGLCTARSLDMVVGLLGILKAGGAYVPLDPAYPEERLSLALEDAQAPVVVTQSACLPLFAGRPLQTVCLDTEWSRIEALPHGALPGVSSPDSLACVIYTSGSTGKPKGVMIPHSSLCNFVRLAGSVLDVTRRDVYLQTASIAYALSVRQLMVALGSGASVVLANAEQMQDPVALFQLVRRTGATLMDMVPSFWRTCICRLADLPDVERRELLENALRRIVSVGEPLMWDVPRDWAGRFGHGAQLVNIFGQTETTGVVAVYPIPRDMPAVAGIVPIGRSLPETNLYILDADLRPVPPGEAGELCVSNPCLASGYLRRPDLSAQKFVPNPFPDGVSARMYRTGDRARLRADGNIELLGRDDRQVKIRGQRLELGEVESALRAHGSVRDCAVVARGDRPEERHLAAYVVSAAGRPSSTELREAVRTRLPEYMVPSVFVFLDRMPLTPNGKIDRLALPDPSAVTADDPGFATHEEPRDHVERTIAAIWKDLLKLDRVGIHDDYFDLGGHSLMSVQMFARIERQLGVRLPLTSLFHATTIADLGRLVAAADADITEWTVIVPVQTAGDKPPFFGIHAVEGGVLFWRHIVSHLPEDQPFYAIQAVGVDGVRTPLSRIPAMAELYIRQIRKIQRHGPYHLGGYSMGGEIAFEVAQQLVGQGETVDLLVLFDTRNPDRSIRPMVRTSAGAAAPDVDAPLPEGERSILRTKLNGHYARWSSLSGAAKFSYLGNQVGVHVGYAALSLLAQSFRLAGRRLPDRLLRPYLRSRHREALANYIPTTYPGKVTLFRATQTAASSPDDSPMGWGPLAAGGMAVHHFDASHEIVSPQYAKQVAERLDACLAEARRR